MMGRFGIPEDQPIENKLITRSLETAQTKIEGFNFDARKHLLEYDNILNHQRRTIYALRHGVLLGERQAVEQFLNDLVTELPEAEEIIESKEKELGKERFLEIVSKLILQAVDIHWMEHLETMDYLRSSVNLRAYGQRDPLVEYKKEGLQLFREMKTSLNQHVLSVLPQIGVEIILRDQQPRKDERNLTMVSGGGQDNLGTTSTTRQASNKKVGRNAPCPCGSGKKYKKCHGV